jgi:Arc/MetJ family transcription regulator
MRTNIVLNDELVEQAMRFSQARTKRALVEECLETYVKVKRREQRMADYRERVRRIQQATAGLDLGESAVDIIRRDRESR